MNIIDENIKLGILEKSTPGMAYAIVRKDKTITGAVGSKIYENPEDKVTPETLYDIASLSKVVSTLTIVSRLIDRREIRLIDKVKKYLPDFQYDDVDIWNLLTHSSGLPADLEGKKILSKEEMKKRLYSADKETKTGREIIYSDLGYFFLGEIIEKVCGKSLDQVAQEEVFEPLNMTSTCYCPSNKEACAPTEIIDERGLVQGIVHDEKACSLGGVAGHAGVFTNAKDLSNFASMILNDGEFNGKQFLSKNMIDLWFTPIVHERDDDERNDKWRSLCWWVGKNFLLSNDNRPHMISFSGFTGPSLCIDRDEGIATVLLDNKVYPTRVNPTFAKFRKHISDLMFRQEKEYYEIDK